MAQFGLDLIAVWYKQGRGVEGTELTVLSTRTNPAPFPHHRHPISISKAAHLLFSVTLGQAKEFDFFRFYMIQM
jgi:hypothetical protein